MIAILNACPVLVFDCLCGSFCCNFFTKVPGLYGTAGIEAQAQNAAAWGIKQLIGKDLLNLRAGAGGGQPELPCDRKSANPYLLPAKRWICRNVNGQFPAFPEFFCKTGRQGSELA